MRLSIQITSNPFSSIKSQRWEPKNPLPPVINALGIIVSYFLLKKIEVNIKRMGGAERISHFLFSIH
jgi:hypothetical protein